MGWMVEFDGKGEKILESSILTGSSQSIILFIRHSDTTYNNLAFEIEVDGVLWVSTPNSAHAQNLFYLMRDHLAEYGLPSESEL